MKKSVLTGVLLLVVVVAAGLYVLNKHNNTPVAKAKTSQKAKSTPKPTAQAAPSSSTKSVDNQTLQLNGQLISTGPNSYSIKTTPATVNISLDISSYKGDIKQFLNKTVTATVKTESNGQLSLLQIKS